MSILILLLLEKSDLQRDNVIVVCILLPRFSLNCSRSFCELNRMVVVDNKPKVTVSHLILLFDLDVEKFYYFAQEPFPCVFKVTHSYC